jgi:MFS family permease
MLILILSVITGILSGISLGLGLDLVNHHPNWLFIALCAVVGAVLGFLITFAAKLDHRVKSFVPLIGAGGGIALFGLLFIAFTYFIVPDRSVSNWRIPVIFTFAGAIPGLLISLIFTPFQKLETVRVNAFEGRNNNSYGDSAALQDTELGSQLAELEEWVQRNWTKGMVRVEPAGSNQRIKVEIYPDNNSLEVELICSPDYPSYPPQALVRLNGRMKMFQSSVLEYWNGSASLVDTVENITALMGFSPQYSLD